MPTGAVSGLQITDTGLGDLVVGEPVPHDSGLVTWDDVLMAWDGPVCGGAAGAFVPPDVEPDDVLSWPYSITTYDPELTDIARSVADPVQLIVVRSPAISTAEGVHAGSTVDELTAAYPEFAAVYEAGARSATELFVLENDVAQTVFEVVPEDASDSAVDGIDAGTVAWVLIEPAARKAFGIASIDVGATCPA